MRCGVNLNEIETQYTSKQTSRGHHMAFNNGHVFLHTYMNKTRCGVNILIVKLMHTGMKKTYSNE